MDKINVSAIVVGFNESSLLKNCVESISFCDEILYFDLGSKDNSVEIAEKAGAKIVIHERVLSCEWIQAKYAATAKNEWILLIDPDEVVDTSLAHQLIKSFNFVRDSSIIGAIRVPWKFYYKNKVLIGTSWGGENSRNIIVNKDRFYFTAEIHLGRKMKPEFEVLKIQNEKKNVVHHYWMRDFKSLLSKHQRYLKNEGQARHNHGMRTSVAKILYTPLSQFYYSYIVKKGYKDMGIGLFLSLFWAWYQTNAAIKLYRFQNSILTAQQKQDLI